MAKNNGSALMFDRSSIGLARHFMSRLLRTIFYALQITNDDFAALFWTTWQQKMPESLRKEYSQKMGSARTTAVGDKLTFNMVVYLIDYMGYDVKDVSMTLRHRQSGKTMEFSTADSLDDIDARILADKPSGITSL